MDSSMAGTTPGCLVFDSLLLVTTNNRMNRTRSISNIIVTAVVVLLLVGLLVKVIFAGATIASLFQYPFQFDESEGMIVAETMLLAQGVPIFENNTPEL